MTDLISFAKISTSTSMSASDSGSTSHEAHEILKEGYLVQWSGINPGTGEPWKPTWMPKQGCGKELVARWEARKNADLQTTFLILPKVSLEVCEHAGRFTHTVGFSQART